MYFRIAPSAAYSRLRAMSSATRVSVLDASCEAHHDHEPDDEDQGGAVLGALPEQARLHGASTANLSCAVSLLGVATVRSISCGAVLSGQIAAPWPELGVVRLNTFGAGGV